MRTWVGLFLAAALAAGVQAKEPWLKVRVTATTEKEIATLLDSEYNVLECAAHPGENDVAIPASDLDALRKLGLPVSIVGPMDDPMVPYGDGLNFLLGTDYTNSFLRYGPMIDQYEQWRMQNPGWMTRTQFGTSTNGRPMYAYKISAARTPNPARKKVVFSALTHAREWGTGGIAMAIADRLLQGLNSGRKLTGLLSQVDVYIVPCLNPDGYEYTFTNNRMWRKNRRDLPNTNNFGVDINRNFAFGWGGSGSSGQTGSETYRGPSAHSEVETSSYNTFIQNLGNVKAVIDFHSYSELILWPWAYTTAAVPAADATRMAGLGTAMQSAIQGVNGRLFTAGPVGTTLYLAAGSSVDQWYSTKGAAAYTIEVRDTGDYGFIMPESEILPNINENYAAAMAMLEFVRANP